MCEVVGAVAPLLLASGHVNLGHAPRWASEHQQRSGCLHRVCSLLQTSTKWERRYRMNVLLIHRKLIFSEDIEHLGTPIPGTDSVLSRESWAGLLCVCASKHTVLKQDICNSCTHGPRTWNMMVLTWYGGKRGPETLNQPPKVKQQPGGTSGTADLQWFNNPVFTRQYCLPKANIMIVTNEVVRFN